MSLMDAKVGDTVMVQLRQYEGGRRVTVAREARVAKVGRKYLYLEGGGVGPQTQFSRKDGFEVSDYGYSAKVYLPEEWATKERRERVLARLEGKYRIRHQNFRFPQSTEALEAIVKILDDDAKERGQ